MESSDITEIIFEIIDNACGFTPTSSQNTTDEKFINEIIAQIIEMAYENYMLCSCPDTTTAASNENCNNIPSIADRDFNVKNQMIVSTMETIPELFESEAIDANDENEEIAESTVSANADIVSIATNAINDETQVIVSTMKTIPELFEPTAIETNNENQVVVSTTETLREMKSEAIETNDENKEITESTVSVNTEIISIATGGINDETQVIILTSEKLPKLPESTATDENQVIVSAEIVPEMSGVIGINDENQEIISTAKMVPELVPESDAIEINDENQEIFSTVTETTDENQVTVSTTDKFPEKSESHTSGTNYDNPDLFESTLIETDDENEVDPTAEKFLKLSESEVNEAIDKDQMIVSTGEIGVNDGKQVITLTSEPEPHRKLSVSDDASGTIEEKRMNVSTAEELSELSESHASATNDNNPELFESTPIETNDELQVDSTAENFLRLHESEVNEANDKDLMIVSAGEIGVNDENQVITLTSEPHLELSVSDASGTIDGNLMNFSTAEKLPELSESHVSGTNDNNPELFESTPIETYDEHQVDVSITEEFSKLPESEVNEANDKDQMIVSNGVIGINDENQVITLTSEPHVELLVSDASGTIHESRMNVSTAEELPELSESHARGSNDKNPEQFESTPIETNDKHQVDVSTAEKFSKLSESEVNETKDQMIVSTGEIGINDGNQVITITSEPHRELSVSDASGTIDKSQKNVSTAEELPELSESHAINENKEITESTVKANTESVLATTVILSSAEADKGNEETVDRGIEIALDVQGAIHKTSANDSTADFYTDELLRHKGYDMLIMNDKVFMTNSSLTVKELKNCEVLCRGLPYGITVNELIPLLEKAGQVYKLRMVERTGIVNVIYATEQDAEKAVNTLDDLKVRRRVIKVSKYFPVSRLFVKPIPYTASKKEIFKKFNDLTKGLEEVLLFNSFEDERKNRGFCYLEYKSNKFAIDAKNIISDMIIFNRKIICDWPDKQMTDASDAVFVSNLGAGISSAHLREHFSVFGEVIEINKNGNFATIVFRNREDSKRALREIDKTKLGNENVQVSDGHLTKIHQGGRNQGNVTERFGPHNDTQKSSGTAATTTRCAPRNDYMHSNENNLRTTTTQSSFGATEQHHGPQKDTMASNQRPFGATTNEHHGPRKDTMSLNHSSFSPTTSARSGPRNNYMHSKENTIRSGTYNIYGHRARNTEQSSFGATEQHHGPQKDTMVSNQRPFGATASEHHGPRKDAMSLNRSSFSPTTSARSGPRNDYMHSNENTPRSATYEKYEARAMNTKQSSARSDVTDRRSPRIDTVNSNHNTASKADRYGPRKDSSTSNNFGSPNERYLPQQKILPLTENRNEQATNEGLGPPKSRSARNAFGQGEKYPKQH